MSEDRLEDGEIREWKCCSDGRCVSCLKAEVERLRKALEEISEGKGRVSRDHFEHCRNTVEDMRALAVKALDPAQQEDK